MLASGRSFAAQKLFGHVSDKGGASVCGVEVVAENMRNHRQFFTTTSFPGGSYEMMVETPVEDKAQNRPEKCSLSQNYPNPFNPGTVFEYSIKTPGQARIELFDILGKHVRTLVDGTRQPGTYTGRWDGMNKEGHAVPAGIYIARMRAGKFHEIKKMG